MKTSPIVWAVAAVIVIAAGIWLLTGKHAIAPVEQHPSGDYKSTTYVIEGQPVVLVNGDAETPSAPGSASVTTTDYFGNDATGDLNGDGAPDTAFILAQNTGGSGTFFYIVVALKTTEGYKGTNGVFLGDRIAPQTIEIRGGELIVNYADRKADDPMTATPSVGVTKYLVVTGTLLKEARPVAGPGAHCGGNIATAPVCGAGYHCAADPSSHLPFGDVGGTCIAD